MSSPTIAPAPGGLPVLGHALQMRKDPLSFFNSLREQGEIVEVKLGPQRFFVLTTPELIRELLVVKPREFDKGAQFDHIRQLLGNGLGMSDGETHKRQRRLMQPAFRRDRIAEYAKLMQSEIVHRTKDWQDGQRFNLRPAMCKLTLGVTCRAMMSSDDADKLVGELEEGFPFVLDVMYKRMTNPLGGLIEKLPLKVNQQFNETLARLRQLAVELVANYRKDTKDAEDAENGRQDLLTMLILARDGEQALDDQEVHDQVMSMLIAGMETTASTLAWAFHALAEHPDVEKRLHAEVDEVLGGRPAEYEDLKQLTYTAQVVSETLRYYPPGWMLTRRAKNDVDLKGYRIPAGAEVMFSPWMVHHDPNQYREPSKFDPDRWSPERAGDISRDAILQFGAGPRKCIGDVFAIVESSLALATIARRWRFRPVPGQKVQPRAAMALWPSEVPMILEERKL